MIFFLKKRVVGNKPSIGLQEENTYSSTKKTRSKNISSLKWKDDSEKGSS